MAALEKLMLTESSNAALTVSETEVDETEEVVILRDLLFADPDTGDFIAIDEVTITGLLDLLVGVEFEAMTFRGVTSSPSTDGYRLTLGEVSITDVNPSFANFLTQIFSLETPGDFDFTDSLFDGIEFADVLVEPIGLATEQPNQFRLGVDFLRFANAEGGLAQSFEMAGFDLQQDFQFNFTGEVQNLSPLLPGRVSIGEIAISNYQLQAFIEILLQEVTANSVAVEAVSTLIGSPIDPGHDGFSVTDASVSFAGLGLETSAFSTDITRDVNGVAIGTNTPNATFAVTVDPDFFLGSFVQGVFIDFLGLEAPVFFTESTTQFDPELDVTTFDAFTFGVVDSLGFSTSGEISDLEQQAQQIAGTDMLFLSDLDTAELITASFTLADDGLVEDLTTLLIDNGGEAGAVLASVIIRTAVRGILTVSENPTFDQNTIDETIDSLTLWLDQGGDLSVSVTPIMPISYADWVLQSFTSQDIGWESAHAAPDTQ